MVSGKTKTKPCSITPQEQANQLKTLKTSFKCKTPAQEEKVKDCHNWITACAAAHIKRYQKLKEALNAFIYLIQPLIFTSNCLKKPLLIRLINSNN